ncbi:MAG: phospholipase/Carboxylesterase, partial [Alphaproteobacteria bacterium]|nr:phospholipase/Carboxylesterase [Alphaproteobacteria bacterium]
MAGPTLAPRRGPATHLVVLVHGYGADGNDLIGLAAHWHDLLPTVAFAAPNAPTKTPGAPGYQWFPITRIDPHLMQQGVDMAGPVLDEYLDAELARLGIPPENLALAGFSQGTMLSLHVGLRRKV